MTFEPKWIPVYHCKTLRWLAKEGKTDKQIGWLMNFSRSTISRHRTELNIPPYKKAAQPKPEKKPPRIRIAAPPEIKAPEPSPWAGVDFS